MNGEENEILHFIAIVPNETDFEKENFIDVRSPNPEDIAQLIVKELSKSNQITVASFGPKTVTSHSYLVGQVSVLDSLLHSFADAKIEVKAILQNSSRRRPSGSSTFYSIKQNNQIDILSKKIQSFPETDYIKVILNIQKYTITLLSLPPFLPFNSKASMKYQINGWNVLMKPSLLVHTRAFALLHFDPNLPTESAVLKFLPNEPREIGKPNDESSSEKLEDSVTISEEDSDEYEDEYNEDDQILSNNSKAKGLKTSNYNKDNNSISDIGSQQKENLLSSSPGGKQSITSSRHSRRSRKSQGRQSTASQKKSKNSQGRDASVNGEYDSQFDVDNNEYPKSNRGENNDEYEEESNEQESSHSKSETKKGNKKTKQKKIIRKKKTKQTINVQQLLDYEGKNAKNGDSESSIPTESNFNDNYDEEEDLNTIEVQIHQFVSNLQLNIPVLTDTSVFSTLFQQLFYERWKSGILSRCRNDLSSLRNQIKERSTDEIAGLRQLVSSRDMTMLINREEKRMQALEAKTVEVIQKVMEKRLSNFANVQQKSLLKNLQCLCGDNVDFNKQLRNKRSETRQQIIELRVLQFSRIEKMQDYHKKVEELELAATGQVRYDQALAELNIVDQETKKLEIDREALLKQREKVLAMLESKKLKLATSSKKK